MSQFREIYLVRHGESEDNVVRRIQGWGGSGLTQRGRLEAASIAARLRSSGITRVYCSDLSRALQTATILALDLGLEPVPDTAFREMRLGPWEGRLLAEVEEEEPELFNQWRNDSRISPYPGIESLEEFRSRLFDGLDRVADSSDGSSAVVSHGGAISVILTAVLGLELRRIWQMPVFNGAVSLILRNNTEWKLGSFNETGHLPARIAPGFDSLEPARPEITARR